jgi:amino acid adenylation domain-containing protein
VISAHLKPNTIPRRAEPGPAPLSFAQNRLWFLDQLRPNNRAYNMLQVFRLKGTLDVPVLERALNEIRRRHDVLRTNFDFVNGEPVQIVAPFQPLALTALDCSDCSEEQREHVWEKTVEMHRRQPFDLKSDPLMRVVLLRFSAIEHVLALIIHHIVCDGWSMRVIGQEIAALHEECSRGGAFVLPELPIQYSDYASWQRRWFQGDVLQDHLSYWKNHLESSPPVLELPADHPRPDRPEFKGGCLTRLLPMDLMESLKSLGQQHHASLFMVLLAAFQVLLGRLSGQEDIVVGVPVAGRMQLETEKLVGLFLNTLALRGDLSGNPTFEQLLQRVRSTALAAMKYQDMPFDQLVAQLQPDRSLNHTPLFQVVLNVLLGDSDIHVPGLAMEDVTPPIPEAKFDMTLYVRQRGPDLCMHLVYNEDLFEAVRMEEMVDQLLKLLEQIAAAPHKRIGSYSLITAKSRQLLPDPTMPLSEPSFAPVTSEFLLRAREFSASAAVVQNDSSWTYAQLATTAKAVAGLLVKNGLQRREVVAVIAPRSFGLVGSIAGVFMSGGVLLTIDRNLPLNRQRRMLNEARATYLLYVGEWRRDDDWLRETPGLHIIVIPETEALAPDLDVSLPDVAPDDPAYIFFTSGTTGIPKAILGCQKSLSHFLAWQKSTFDVGPSDRCAQLTRLSFDVILRDIFLPLISGGTICLPDDALDVASDRVLSWMDHAGITVFHAGPSLAQTWLANGKSSRIPRSLRWAFFAGEPLTQAFVEQWRHTLPHGIVVNLYGPTETTLVKCFHVVAQPASYGIQSVGRPLPQTQALVLNSSQKLCGLGEPGEIVIRTPFRTLGYINAPEEQQKRFVPNPFRDEPADLTYRTGDLGRYHTDGTLEFLGRMDDQVKIRGVRIEPAEITAILGRHPSVTGCFVMSRKDAEQNDALVAYVATSPKSVLSASDLRQYLSADLPPVMIPSAFVFLDAVPLTLNGKVDRRALPFPDTFELQRRPAIVPPRTPAERSLAGIWRRVLKTNEVGVHDNFFDIGGHSLIAMQLVSHIRQEFKVDLPVRMIFTKPTIEALALYILEKRGMASGQEEIEELLAEVESLSEENAELQLEHLEKPRGDQA